MPKSKAGGRARLGWDSGLSIGTVAATGLVVLLLSSGCEDRQRRDIVPTGSTSSNGIVVESATLESRGSIIGACGVKGTVRNESTSDLLVTLVFTPFDAQGRAFERAQTPKTLVRAGAQAGYLSEPFTTDRFDESACQNVARLDVEIRTEVAT